MCFTINTYEKKIFSFYIVKYYLASMNPMNQNSNRGGNNINNSSYVQPNEPSEGFYREDSNVDVFQIGPFHYYVGENRNDFDHLDRHGEYGFFSAIRRHGDDLIFKIEEYVRNPRRNYWREINRAHITIHSEYRGYDEARPISMAHYRCDQDIFQHGRRRTIQITVNLEIRDNQFRTHYDSHHDRDRLSRVNRAMYERLVDYINNYIVNEGIYIAGGGIIQNKKNRRKSKKTKRTAKKSKRRIKSRRRKPRPRKTRRKYRKRTNKKSRNNSNRRR